ncbi:MAG: hypothetical protein ACLQVI_39870 [Polyangiaceae bacterium]
MSAPHDVIGAALRTRPSGAVLAFARGLAADARGILPCWGDLALDFDRLLVTDDARLDAFEALRAAGDLGALVVFLDLNRSWAGVLAEVWKLAPELPATIQCALVSLDASAPVPANLAARLHPAARALLENPAARARDHEVYAAHAAALRAFRTRAPQVSEPGVRTP